MAASFSGPAFSLSTTATRSTDNFPFPFQTSNFSLNHFPSLRHTPRLRLLCHAAGAASQDVSASKAGQDRLLKVPIANIRNFCIIAHIDHGKSTLADKLLEITGTVQKREMKEQFLDNMDLERERGITIKLQAARMRYVYEEEPYCLNLIDTPGHVDFSYEVSRSLAACEGALLVVDASQGVEAQTLANVYLALENNLEIIPVLNKIDLPGADPDRVSKEIEEIVGLDCSNAIHCSAKKGIGITEILNAIVQRIPPPSDSTKKPLRALIFDSYYDPYRGVVAYFRVIDGTLKKGDRIYFMASGKDYYADEIGVLSPNQMQANELHAGEVGYLSASIRSVADARVGDTITRYDRKAEVSLPGYQEATPMVFCGLFPVDADQFPDLRDALEKLQLNDAALKVPIANIRNFCIIAHIDHGKSTLADKLLEITGTVQKREMKEQFLDNMDLERERGITIKLQAARMRYVYEEEPYCLNLIDTPGHVDFSYEVSRSLAACEGALLVVDASQGVEAQTLANVYLALENNLEIIPVLNKIDLPGADPDRVSKEIEEIVGLDCSNAIHCSAKEGIGITEILNAIVQRIPPPSDSTKKPLRALIFDSYYDPYRGVVAYFRVIDGTLKKGDRIYFMASGKDYYADEIGVLSPNQMQANELHAGEVGYLSASIRSVADARVGDTITRYDRKAEVSLPGYQEATPMVFCGLFPVDADQFPDLRDALEKLQLNDAALKFEPESSSAMGFGFRCGFLGLLHMEIIQERLEREYNLSLITTAPSVVYRVNCVNGETVECSNPSLLPEPGKRKSIEEPYVKIELLTPKEYIGPLMELAQDRRGEFKEMKFITEIRASIIYQLPLAEMVGDFFDQLKSRSKGYASMEYTFVGYTESDLVKLDILINGDCVEPLATIVHKDKAYSVGRALTQKLKELIPRQMFKVPIQACIGAKVIASEAISAIRKDVLAKCYGGDISRKKKLLRKQAEGKKRMKSIGRVDVPQEAFMAVLKLEKEVV